MKNDGSTLRIGLLIWITYMFSFLVGRAIQEGNLPVLRQLIEGPYWWVLLLPGAYHILEWLFTRKWS